MSAGSGGSAASAESFTKAEKYSRLAAEYSKLRTHLTVLKKGFADEQTKNAELKETVRDRELRLRKSELEVDSLGFRNQQLTKRITVLQEDVETLQSHKNSKKGKHKNDDRGQPIRAQDPYGETVLQEELQKKIIENARLVSQMADKEFELSQLTLRMSDMEKQLSEAESKYKCEMLKMKIQRQELTNKLENALSHKDNLSISHKNISHPSNLTNGDFAADAGSLIGSEDALSVEDSHPSDMPKLKNDRLIEIEQENQNLKIELDLLKLEINSLKSNKNFDENPQVEVNVDRDTLFTTLGKMDSPMKISDEVIAREETLKDYFRTKVTALVSEKQKYESMTRYFTDETDGLKVRIDCLKKEKNAIEDGLYSGQSTIQKLEDELHSTNSNYEQQVTLLTEHVGNLNDKLAQQVEEIQQLKGNMCIKK